MGTRADFYIGTGEQAEWLGSIAWDGYPDGVDRAVLDAGNESDYRAACAAFIGHREDGTLAHMGWPWPWEDSGTTDFAYALTADGVRASCFGSPWQDPFDEAAWDALDDRDDKTKIPFPYMGKGNTRAGDRRSGVMVVTAPVAREN